jgi:hypothetical protein
MLSPLLIIGVGGAGGKTIRAMKQELNRILDSSGYTGGIPEAWQFLQIDTTRGGEEFAAPMLPADEFHCVVPQGSNYGDILSSITARGGSLHEQQGMLAGWGIPAPAIWINSSPRQDRAIGRLAIMADAGKTLQAIQTSISKMKGPIALAELAEVAKKLGAKSPDRTPQAFIFSSLGGGSGSGMFMDVAELLKRATAETWAQDAISFLYTSEVFRSIGAAGKSVSNNTLGAMNELIASQWVGISDRSNLLYWKLGLVPGNNASTSGYGCKTNILIGPRNRAGVDISVGATGEGMDEVFLNFGTSLAGVICNDVTYEFLIQSYRYRSWKRGALDISGLAPGNLDDLTGVSSMGFGQLRLGADRIVEYVADALTKSQVEKLLWPDFIPELPAKGKSRVDLIQEQSDKIWANFLLSSGVDERGSQDQILDAIFPEDWKANVKQHVISIISKNIALTPIPLARFARAVSSDWVTGTDKFLDSELSEVNTNARKWVDSIQDTLRELIAQELMRNGYEVVIDLVSRLEVELKEHVVWELLQHHNDDAEKFGGFDDQALAKGIHNLADGLAGVGKQNAAFLDKISVNLSRVLEGQINSRVNALAASLVQDLLSFFVAPMKEQLVEARHNLQSEQRATIAPNGSKNLFNEFPKWGSGFISDRYKPRSNERVLIDHTEYESTYEFYANKDSQGTPAFLESVDSALIGKKMSPTPGDVSPQSLITVSNPWITSIREAQGTMGFAASKSKWNLHTGIEELSIKNRSWLRDSESSFGNFTNLSIRDYVTTVSTDPQIRADRESKFVNEFQAMLAVAQPLILLNPKAMEHILAIGMSGNAAGFMMKSSPIPFKMSSPVGQACTRVLEQSGFNPSNPSFEQDWFDVGSNDTIMFAIATTSASLPAWAFASLTEPILEQVAQSKNQANTWIQFWEGRRSRPLIEAIPFETEIRRSIITGWFVASLFGLRKVRRVPVGRSVQIWNPTLETPGWSAFPSPLLNSHHEDLSRDNWVLPQLLVSAGIALAEFGKSGSAESINGYRLLKYLGREVTTSMANRDMWDANGAGDLLPTGARSQSYYLKNWVISGEMPDKNLELLQLLQESLASSDSRSAALIQTVEVIRAQYNDIWNEFSSTAWHSLPETWELKEDIDLALSDIALYVSELRNSTPSNIA